MALNIIPGLSQSLLSVILLYSLYHVYWELTVGASRREMIRKHGCKPMKRTKELYGFPENIIGTKTMYKNMKALKQLNFLATVRNRFLKHGLNLHTRLLFTDIYLTSEPDNLKTIMAVNFKDWGYGARRTNGFLPLLGHGIFTNEGAAWQHSRELLRPNFNRSLVGNLDVYEIHVNHLIKAIPRDGSTINLQDIFFQMTMDSATEFLFGESTNCLLPGQTSEASSRFAGAFARSQHEISLMNRFGKIYYLNRLRGQFREDIKTCHDFVDHFVRKGLAYRETLDLSKDQVEGGEPYVFLYEIVKRTGDAVQIRSELMNVLLAGRDTTASLLSDLWFILARRPDVWTKLRKEVDELGGQPPTFQQIKDMKYLKMCLNETLRLYPVVPANARASKKDTVLPLGGGEDGKSPLFIPKGQTVQWHLFTIHRRKDFYGEDAEEFKPERWETLRTGWEYLPFNGGPRICVGQQFALTEASYTTIRLMQEFKAIEARDSRPWQEGMALTCAIEQGTIIGLTPA